jgi:hypothetical protein
MSASINNANSTGLDAVDLAHFTIEHEALEDRNDDKNKTNQFLDNRNNKSIDTTFDKIDTVVDGTDNNVDGLDDDGNTITESQDEAEVDVLDTRYGDISYRPRSLVLYCPPKQRQKWGETQVLPRVNWGDLFFDLFYVAAAYNVSYIIVKSPSRFGFLYSVGTYWPLHGFGFHKTFFDARFAFDKEDLYHRLFEIAHCLVLSVAVLAIRPVYVMATPSKYGNMFVFSLALVLDRILAMLRYVELYFIGIGEQPALKKQATREIFFTIIATPFYLASAIIAGIDYIEGKRAKNEMYLSYNTSSYSDGKNNSLTRLLADEGASSNTYDDFKSSYPITHLPIYLCLFGYVAFCATFTFTVIFCLPSDGRHKETYVNLVVALQT